MENIIIQIEQFLLKNAWGVIIAGVIASMLGTLLCYLLGKIYNWSLKKYNLQRKKERFINYTMMGEADEKNENYYYPLTNVESMMVTMYQWYSDEGGEMLKVLCKDGKVFEVTKQWQEFYWTEEGMPDFTGKKIVKKVNDTEERYDMERYSNEEDFYYDNYYDYLSYEDAERYYREHKK